MKKPDFPSDEKERIADLHSLNILDTASEERFDRLTRMAKRMFNVPIALVSLVDENRQWFKSCFGVDVSETPRDISFCGHTILGDDIFLIPNALEDERFADNPLVTDTPNIRFYAGAPLKLSNSRKMGTLCIIDDKPRSFDEEDLTLLKDLAVMVENEIAAIQCATLDELTKISNRRGFMMLSQKSIAYCKRHKVKATLAYLDLDNFKPINDSFGHKEGDYALTVFSQLMLENIRESDLFARLGGDEFVVLFTNTSKSNAQIAMDEFSKRVDEYNKNSNKDYEVLFSCGLIEFDESKHQNIEDLLHEADEVMYKNKEEKNVKN